MGFFRTIETRRNNRNFSTDVTHFAQQHNLSILGDITEKEGYHANEKRFFLRFGLDGQIYSVTIEYNYIRHCWWVVSFSGNGFNHVFDCTQLGSTPEDVVIKLRDLAQMLSVGLFSVPHSQTFSLVERGKETVSTIGVGVSNYDNVYYLYKSDMIKMNLPLSLLTTSYYTVECFKMGAEYISEWEYERHIQPIIVTDDRNLALKVLLTVRECQRHFND